MVVGSLFSGIGGMDYGLANAGFNHAFLCEYDPWRRGVLKERFPGVEIFEDVCKISVRESESGINIVRHDEIADDKGRETGTRIPMRLDLLCGGFPCQDLSHAGKREGLHGEKSRLFFEFARIADESIKSGDFILIENVPGLLSSNQGADFRLVLQTLCELGFNDLAWRILDSQYFGVPQKRRRLFILGRRIGEGTSCGRILLEPEGGDWNFKKIKREKKKYSPTSLTGIGSGGPDDNDAQNGRLIAHPLVKNHGNQDHTIDNFIPEVTSTLQSGKKGHRFDADSIEQYIPSAEIAETLSSNGRNYDFEKINLIPNSFKVRKLTPIECERLQGLPDDWTNVGKASNSRRYSAIGDAVTANVAEWIGRRIKEFKDSPEIDWQQFE